MSRKLLVFLFSTLFFINAFSLKAQVNTNDLLPLIDVLETLSKRYNVSFTYIDRTIEGKSTYLPPKDITLSDALSLIATQTQLSFTTLEDGNIIIRTSVSTTEFKTQLLEEILVTNYLTKGIALKNDGVTQIKPNSFGILPGLIEPDVLQTIQALPGITSVDERVSNVNVRGGTHDQNLILWDGIKMYQSGHFFGLVSAFNPYLTEEVLVSKNGTSAIYGDGVSSIIDMRSSNHISNKTQSGIGANLISVDGYTKIPFSDKTELQLSARRSITDILTTPTYDQYFERVFQDTDLTNQNNTSISKNESFYFYDVSAKLLHDISAKDKLRFNFLNVYNTLKYQEQSTVNNIAEALNSNLTQRNLAVSIDYLRTWSDKVNTNAQIYFSNYDLKATNFDVINNQRLIQENEVYENGLRLHVNYNIENNLTYLGGYQFNETGISNLEDVNNPIFRRYIKEVIRSHALINEVKFTSKSKNTSARIGLRANYFEKFSEFLMEPRISFNQKFLNNFRIELLAEVKSQTTSQVIDLQNDFLGVEKRRWVLANNDNIPIIKSKQASLGIHYKKNNLILSVEAYTKDVDGISTRSQGFQNQYQYVNTIGSYNVKGVDFLINKQFDNFSTWLSYSFSKNDYTFKDLNFNEPFPNNLDVRHTATFAGTYTYKGFKLALGANWRTGKPFTGVNENMPLQNPSLINYDTPNGENIDDYIRTDISTTYNFNFSNKVTATAGFSLWNVLNRKNIINTYYIIGDNNSISKVENTSLGITPNFSFRVNF